MATKRVSHKHLLAMILAVTMIGPMVFASGLLPVGGNSGPLGALSNFSAAHRTYAQGGSLGGASWYHREGNVSRWLYVGVERGATARASGTVGEQSAPVLADSGLTFRIYLERCRRRHCTSRFYAASDLVVSNSFSIAPDFSGAQLSGRINGKPFLVNWVGTGQLEPHGYGYQATDRGTDHAGVEQYESDGVFRSADVSIKGPMFKGFGWGEGDFGYEGWDYSTTWATFGERDW